MESGMNFDNEVLAYLSTRKDELMQQHDEYIAEHTEIREVLNDFLSSVLLHKPVSLQLHGLCRFPFAVINNLLRIFIERCLRICQGVLPPIQSNTSQK